MKHTEKGTLRAYLDSQLDPGKLAPSSSTSRAAAHASEIWRPCVKVRHVCATVSIGCLSCPQ